MRKRTHTKPLTTIILYVLLALTLVFVFFPLYWMLVTSLKTPTEANELPPTMIPRAPTLDAFKFLLETWHYPEVLMNTFVVATFSALGATILSGMAAYAINRLRFPGRSAFYGFMVATLALPGMVTIGPIFMTYKNIGLLDTRLGLTLVFLSGGLPLAMLIVFSTLNSIPRDIDDAAAIDGCSWFDTLFRVMLPIALPSFVVSFLLNFIGAWNEFLFAYILSVTPERRVLTVRLFEMPYRGDVYMPQYDIIAAGGVLVLLPILPILILGQKRLVEGILAGATSGT
jgi:multiple sugar transport system permease protein